MRRADVKEWLASPVTERYFAYLNQRIAALKDARRDGAFLNTDPHAMFRANWELAGGLAELGALADLPKDPEQIDEVFGDEHEN